MQAAQPHPQLQVWMSFCQALIFLVTQAPWTLSLPVHEGLDWHGQGFHCLAGYQWQVQLVQPAVRQAVAPPVPQLHQVLQLQLQARQQVQQLPAFVVVLLGLTALRLQFCAAGCRACLPLVHVFQCSVQVYVLFFLVDMHLATYLVSYL